MQNAWRSYLELAAGLSEASRKRATEVVRRLSSRSGATVEQLQQVAGDLSETGAMNRDALVTVVRSELDRALAAVGLAKADEVARLAERVERLERLIAETKPAAAGRAASSEVAERTGRAGSSAAVRPASRGTATARSGAATRGASRTRSSGSTRAPAVAAGHGTGGTASGRSATTAAAKRGAKSSGTSAAKRTAKRSSGTHGGSESAEHPAPGREES